MIYVIVCSSWMYYWPIFVSFLLATWLQWPFHIYICGFLASSQYIYIVPSVWWIRSSIDVLWYQRRFPDFCWSFELSIEWFCLFISFNILFSYAFSSLLVTIFSISFVIIIINGIISIGILLISLVIIISYRHILNWGKKRMKIIIFSLEYL